MSNKKTAAFMLVGEKHQGKSSIACAAFERAIFMGRRVDMEVAAAVNGVSPTHIEDVMRPFIDALIEKMRAIKGNEDWQPPSVAGYTVDAYNFLLDELCKPKWADAVAEYDAIVFDEVTAVFDESKQRWAEAAEKHWQKAQRTPILKRDTLVKHRHCTNDHKPNLMAIYAEGHVTIPRLVQKASRLNLSPVFIFHTRESETKGGVYRKAHPQMMSRNLEKKALRPVQEVLFLVQDDDYRDGFSTDREPFAPKLIARMNHPEYECSSKYGVIPGEGPGNLWAVVQRMGLSARRAEGRERMTKAVEHFADEFAKQNVWIPREQAKLVYNAMKNMDDFKFPFSCTRKMAIRHVYQQASALAWYRREAEKDPFAEDSSLTESTQSDNGQVSQGKTSTPKWD